MYKSFRQSGGGGGVGGGGGGGVFMQSPPGDTERPNVYWNNNYTPDKTMKAWVEANDYQRN